MGGKRPRLTWISPRILSLPQSYQSCQERVAEADESKAREAAEEEDSSDSESPDSLTSNAIDERRIVGKHDASCRY